MVYLLFLLTQRFPKAARFGWFMESTLTKNYVLSMGREDFSRCLLARPSAAATSG